MKFPSSITTIALKAQTGALSMDEVSSTAKGLDVPLHCIMDMVSLEVAGEYESGNLSFDLADHAMNQIWGALFSQPPSEIVIPEITQDIFGAFDQGEYYHSEDSRDIDPEEKYTKPLLRAALTKHRHNDA